MKQLLNFAFLAVFAFFSSNVSAQISLGVKAGVNIATVSLSDEFSPEGASEKSTVGFLFGGVAQFGLSDMFSIQPEVLYYQKGYVQEFEASAGGFDLTVTWNYLEVPVLLKANFGDSDKLNYYEGIGPSMGYALDATFDDGTNKEDIDFEQGELSRLDWSLALDAGVNVPAGSGSLMLNLRYMLGISNIKDSPDPGDAKHRGIEVSIGDLFPLGKEAED